MALPSFFTDVTGKKTTGTNSLDDRDLLKAPAVSTPIHQSTEVLSPSRPITPAEPILRSNTNILSEDVEIDGSITFNDNLTIDGKILNGTISSEGQLTIGKNAIINAEIHCGNVIVQGNVKGNITAKQNVELHENAIVHGNIKAKNLIMSYGASFMGQSQIGGTDTKVVTTPVQTSRPPQTYTEAVAAESLFTPASTTASL